MKTLLITVEYDADTRLLGSTVALNGFIANLPGQTIGGMQADTITLFAGLVMSAADAQCVVASVAKSLAAANVQLAQWAAAAENKGKADLLPTPAPVPAPVPTPAPSPAPAPTPAPDDGGGLVPVEPGTIVDPDLGGDGTAGFM